MAREVKLTETLIVMLHIAVMLEVFSASCRTNERSADNKAATTAEYSIYFSIVR
jgi:hypothetical protein